MITYEMRKPVKFEHGNKVGVTGENHAHTQKFFIKGMTDEEMTYVIFARFPDGSANSIKPAEVSVNDEGTLIVWEIEKNDIFCSGYFEVQLQGSNSSGVIFQTEITRLFADESIAVEDGEFENPNSLTLKLRDETLDMLSKISEQQKNIDENYHKMDGKLDNAEGSVKTKNIANEAVTVEKLAEDVKRLIDSKVSEGGSYVLTEEDKQEIAKLINLSTPEGAELKENKIRNLGKSTDRDTQYPTAGAVLDYLWNLYSDNDELDEKLEELKEDLEWKIGQNVNSSVNTALAQAKASGEFDGENGKDGANGKDGKDGADGKSAYQLYFDNGGTLTEEQWLASLSQTEPPKFVQSIDEMTDKSKMYVMPDGYIWAYMTKSATTVKPELSNTDEYLIGYRFGSDGTERADTPGGYITNYLPVDMSLADPLVMRFQGKPPFYGSISTNEQGSITERVCFYDKNKSMLGYYIVCHKPTNYAFSNNSVIMEGAGQEWTYDVGYVYNSSSTKVKASFYNQIAYLRFNCVWSNDGGPNPIPDKSSLPKCSITLDAQGGTETVTGWMSTGLAYSPADYEDRIIGLENKTEQLSRVVNSLGSTDGKTEVPDYWLYELKNGANDINRALEAAGSNKSAFLFYTDIHYDYGSQMSPKLLKYLHEHTAINKTIFGGDAVNTESTNAETMAYLWDWRYAVRNLPNHHSVVGNHDDGNATNRLFDPKYIYAFLLASEESDNIVHGGDFYYYIDDKCEKTRYLYLDTAYNGVDDAQLIFVKNSLKETPEGWHIVAIAHAWYDPDYNQYDVRPIPLVGFTSDAEKLLAVFDNYNARLGEFASCKGKVEFCIGGHVHRDYDGKSQGGIPIIICTTDSKHNRDEYTFADGTTTESSVNGIIADYDASKITIVRVGRGKSRVVNY